jgi:hypothetical protein
VGMFKQMKDLKTLTQAAPDMIQAAQQAGLEAQRLGAAMQAQQAAAFQAAPAAVPTAGALEPIAGVTLDRYAEVSRGLAAYGYDTSKAVTVAAGFGISAADWQTAMDGWNARIAADPAVASAFNRAYTGR